MRWGAVLSRRQFLASLGATVFALRSGELPVFGARLRSELAKRTLGRTGWKATILGFGGGTIASLPRSAGAKVVRHAIERGINYVDTASSYGDHDSEAAIGRAIKEGGLRPRIYLTTKILRRSRRGAEREFKDSLRMLGTEPDLLQLHSINTMDELDEVMKKGGSFEAAIEAKKKGYIRHIGITGHTRPEVIAKALKRYRFHTALIPLSAPDSHLHSFEPVIEKARKRGTAVIAMKVLAAGRGLSRLSLDELLHYALNLPIATAIVGFRSEREVDQSIESALRYRPLDEETVKAIRRKAKMIGTDRVLWWKRR